MSSQPKPISSKGFEIGTTQSITELHISGGIRAGMQGDRVWGWYPVLRDGSASGLNPIPINGIATVAQDIGETLFGGDQQNDVDKQLISRIWTPLDGAGQQQMQPADMWSCISSSAHDAGDADYAILARHIAFSIHAAGIRLRDASDGFQAQLFAAIDSGRKSGERYTNIPVSDIHLAFHSVLSEMASARDYIATALAHRMGAPARIDALNRLTDWLDAPSRAHHRGEPVIKEMFEALDANAPQPWLHMLTQYRNTFLHRRPLGSQESSQYLCYSIVERQGIPYPKVELPLGGNDEFAPGQDALKHFIGIYREMTKFARLAAQHAPYESSLPHFVVSDSADE